MMAPQLVTVKDAARRLSLSPRTVAHYIARRKLAVVRLGRAVRITEAELQRLIAEYTQPAVRIWEGQR